MTRRTIPLALLVALFSLAGPSAGQDRYADPELTPKDREHWSFVPPRRAAIPKTKYRVANPIDAFIRARLAKEGLKPAPEADKLALIRRVTLDLTGLPPTPEEVDAFLKDASPDAYEKVVERLLASPHFGERWAGHWLDVVRFAESNGYEADAARPHAWRYRDYVVKSFNADKPYDQFVKEQIAGDELAEGKTGAERAELLIATGMHRCGPVHRVGGNLDDAMIRQETMTEIVNGVGAAFLGLTFACCRCHDHKFDALSAGDYYRLQAFFGGARYADVDFATKAERDAYKKAVAAINAKAAPIKAQIAALDAPVRAKVAAEKRAKLDPKFKAALDTPAEKRTPEQKTLAVQTGTLLKVTWDEVLAAMPPDDLKERAKLREQLHALEAQLPPPTAAAWAIQNTAPETKTFVLLRGNPHKPAAEAKPAYPRVLAFGAQSPKSRRDLAEWLTRPDHPLTARVIVNRLWHYHFGRGLVATPNDFGVRGELPTHPELLDWLACELVRPTPPTPLPEGRGEKKGSREKGTTPSGSPSLQGGGRGVGSPPWSLKHIHRLIVTSATYKQSSSADHGAKVDPANKLLWKMPRRRLEAEAVRDSILAAAGTLNREVGGPSVKVPLEPEVYALLFTEGEPDGLWHVTPDARQHARRSIYLFNKRNVRLPMLEALDQPDTLNSCAARPVSTFAPQALILMNSPFVHAQAKALAVTLTKESGDAGKQVDALYRRAVGRLPTATERDLALNFLKDQTATVRARQTAGEPIGLDAKELPAGADAAQVRALADLCVVVFNTHEFVYMP